MASGSYLLPYEIMLGAVWTLRSTMPFSARAGRDLNNDGVTTTDYVPGTTRNMGNREEGQCGVIYDSDNERLHCCLRDRHLVVPI